MSEWMTIEIIHFTNINMDQQKREKMIYLNQLILQFDESSYLLVPKIKVLKRRTSFWLLYGNYLGHWFYNQFNFNCFILSIPFYLIYKNTNYFLMNLVIKIQQIFFFTLKWAEYPSFISKRNSFNKNIQNLLNIVNN